MTILLIIGIDFSNAIASGSLKFCNLVFSNFFSSLTNSSFGMTICWKYKGELEKICLVTSLSKSFESLKVTVSKIQTTNTDKDGKVKKNKAIKTGPCVFPYKHGRKLMKEEEQQQK